MRECWAHLREQKQNKNSCTKSRHIRQFRSVLCSSPLSCSSAALDGTSALRCCNINTTLPQKFLFFWSPGTREKGTRPFRWGNRVDGRNNVGLKYVSSDLSRGGRERKRERERKNGLSAELEPTPGVTEFCVHVLDSTICQANGGNLRGRSG